MDPALRDIVLTRLDADPFLAAPAKQLVLAAADGESSLAAALDGDALPDQPSPPIAKAPPAHAFLRSISVEGFRGIGPRAALTLRPGPGLTLVIGRNGSGKSSFAEALEILLTGDNRRWAGRSAAWKEDWRNLHEPHTLIEGRLLVEGDAGPATVQRRWPDGEKEVGHSTLEVQRTGRQKGDLRTLGWNGEMQTYRPFLSYNELGSMLDEGPSKLYDALSTVLGLEDLVTAQDSLRQARLNRQKALKNVTSWLPAVRARLASCDDPRARACLAALQGKVWDLSAVEALVVSGSQPPPSDDLARLQRLAACQGPDAEVVARAAEELGAAAAQATAVAGTQSERALQRAELLEQALSFHRTHGGGDCPVCGTAAVLGSAWEAESAEEVRSLRAEAQAADDARRRLDQAWNAAVGLLSPAPSPVKEALGLGVDASVNTTLQQWGIWCSSGAAGDPEELALLLLERAGPLDVALTGLRKAASEEIARREDLWRPVAVAVAEWAGPARDARDKAGAIPAITAAEDWVKAASATIRDERFAPIAGQATHVWEGLRGESNVTLERISLGAWPQRKVTLDVTVDGVGGAALGVMSQGELHSLALSLFLPRATLPGSPFGFIVIDDPVQSMDPARVEGLARVLEEAAKSRQVIVFTHDDRLPEACRRLQVGAEMIEISRRAGSVLELSQPSGPVERYLDDARAIARTDQLTEAVVTRVAGVFCRLALEAACTETVMRRRLSRGEPHAQVESLIAGAEKLNQKAALALFDDQSRVGDVLPRLNRIGPWAADVYQAANKGAHQAVSAARLNNIVDDTGRLAKQLALQP